MLEQDFYQFHIAAARKDTRLQMADFAFYVCILNLFDITGREYLHESMREYEKEMPLALGTIGNAIPRLVEYGYLRGSLYPKDGGRDSWRLYLVDLRSGKKPPPTIRPPLASFTHEVEGYRITLTVEDVVVEE